MSEITDLPPDDENNKRKSRNEMIRKGVELGHEGADRAANKVGEEWKAKAMEVFIKFARSHQTFTNEDVRLANPEIGCNGDLRAWGHIATAAKKSGVVEHRGYSRSISPRVHSSINTLWGSLIFEGN